MAEIGSLFVKIGSKFDSKGLLAAKTQLGKLQGWVKANSAQFKQLALAGAAMGAAVTYAALKAAKAAGIQQQAEHTLAEAMKVAGTYTEEAHRHNLEYAASLQKVTTYGDEAIMTVQKMLTNFKVEGPLLDKLTKATLDLAAAKGMDLKAAGDLVAKSVGSSTNALTRYGITVEGAVGSTERLQMAAENITALFGGAAQAQANTYLGRIEQLKNRWGDFVEQIGFKVIPIIEEFMDIIEGRILPAMEDWIGETKDTTTVATNFAKILQFIIKAAMGVVAAIQLSGDALAVFTLFTRGHIEAGKLGWKELTDKVSEYGDRLKLLSEEEIILTDETEAAKTEIKDTAAATDQERLALKLAGEKDEKEKALKADKERMKKLLKIEQEKTSKLKALSQDLTMTLMQGIMTVANAEKITWKSSTKLFVQALKERLRQFIAEGIQEIIAAKIKNLAKAVMNATVTFGFAAGQIAAVLTAAAVGIAGLRALPSFDMPGVVPGPIGKPVVVQALGGEKFGGRQSIGAPSISVLVTGNTILDDEQAEFLADKISEKIHDRVKVERGL